MAAGAAQGPRDCGTPERAEVLAGRGQVSARRRTREARLAEETVRMLEGFRVGDRVRRVELPGSNFIPSGLLGVIVRRDAPKGFLVVLWDGQFGERISHPDFLELA